MARGKKKLSLEEQLEKITNEIENMKSSLKEMESAKKDIEEQIRLNRLSQIDDMINESGLSIEEVMQRLTN